MVYPLSYKGTVGTKSRPLSQQCPYLSMGSEASTPTFPLILYSLSLLGSYKVCMLAVTRQECTQAPSTQNKAFLCRLVFQVPHVISLAEIV